MTHLADGDISLTGIDNDVIERLQMRQDEVGDTGRGMERLVKALDENTNIAAEIAAGNLQIKV